MLAKVLSGAVIGIDAYTVDVEVDIAAGLPSFTTVGLPEVSVKQSKVYKYSLCRLRPQISSSAPFQSCTYGKLEH